MSNRNHVSSSNLEIPIDIDSSLAESISPSTSSIRTDSSLRLPVAQSYELISSNASTVKKPPIEEGDLVRDDELIFIEELNSDDLEEDN